MSKNISKGIYFTEKIPIKHFLLITRITIILLLFCVFCSMADTGSYKSIGIHEIEKTAVIQLQKRQITGTILDELGEPVIGANIIESGTTNGTVTDVDGRFTLSVEDDATILISYIGYLEQEINTSGQTTFNIVLQEDTQALEEVVVIGYGAIRKSDLTGSVSRITDDVISERTGVSLMQSLQGSTAGLNVAQVNQAGQNPDITVRGRNTLSGTQSPLIVLDGVIFRGNIVDINPSDIESIDVLKDASSTAIYGSQASNGVLIITSKTGRVSTKPIVTYSGRYTYETPSVEFIPETAEQHLARIAAGYFFDSRTKESGYLSPNTNWDILSVMRDGEQVRALNNNLTFDWYDYVTNDNMYTQNHNISLQQRSENSGYFVSIGYTDQAGYMLNEDYNRWNARINLDNEINKWLKIGLQTFMTISDYSGQNVPIDARYRNDWYDPAYLEDGTTLNLYPNAQSGINPMFIADADDYDKRYDMFGNIYTQIQIPFIKGLSFRPNFSINYTTDSEYSFQDYAKNFIGSGSKYEMRRTDMINDYLLTYVRSFNNIHSVNATLVYGTEKRTATNTSAEASGFVSKNLGYNRLQAGDASLQAVESGAWEESSIFTMARLIYGFKQKYLFTGTVRRDGFSGFSANYKYGTFPSAAIAWVISEESFMQSINSIDNLKIRLSYGSNGNRTIGRYQTLARINGNFGYLDGNNNPVYSQSIVSLASPNLKWETTTGFNLGLDFMALNQRIWGTIDYYNNDTKNLLYNVDIPGISRFETFPDNLGKIHNFGIEATLSSINIRKPNFEWSSSLIFSLNRDKLVSLLGFDNDGDGVEDDLISEGLFIGEPLNAVYDYYTSGDIYQLEDYFAGNIPATADVGSYKILDYDESGVIDPLDKHILGTSDPLFRFSLDNNFKYKNWKLSFFINSIIGNRNFYLGQDDLLSFNTARLFGWDNLNMPANADFWTPENPDSRYQRMGVNISDDLTGRIYKPRSFVRLQDINLSYNFDKSILDRFSVQELRLFFNAKNPLTITNWNGWDPETGEKITMTGRPVMKGYTLGLEIKF